MSLGWSKIFPFYYDGKEIVCSCCDVNHISEYIHWKCDFSFNRIKYRIIIGPSVNEFVYWKDDNTCHYVAPNLKLSPQTLPEALRIIKLLTLS